MSIKFKNREHEKFYEQCLARTGGLDPYHKAFFYTMSISNETRKHVEDVFDFQEEQNVNQIQKQRTREIL